MMPLTQLTTRTATRAARLNARRYPRKHHAPQTGVQDMALMSDAELLQNIADHNADLQEMIDHLWRIVTRIPQDNDGLDTRIKYEQAAAKLEYVYGKAPDTN